jgi:hypothetical protein
VRSRWQDRVIALTVVALTATGIWALWGDELARLFGGPEPAAAEGGPSTPEGSGTDLAPTAAP